ncbi:hypothetical protein HMPREF1051_0197 [Neisseria sicca VK64]|uniref:Uncharacterized protein n=1 Tax=Neisseria sicca VK64 TaxID=1095748 RepID=I2NUQ8_NEISI|nr:hypothetical protein HMPREF1051_0197 [Neisseria sicca VK64]
MIRGRLKLTFRNVSDDLFSTSHQCSLPASLIQFFETDFPQIKTAVSKQTEIQL